MLAKEITTTDQIPLKPCKKCGEEKPLTSFPKCATARDGRGGRCFVCAYAARAPHQTQDQKARQSTKIRQWKVDNLDAWRQKKKAQKCRARERKALIEGRAYTPMYERASTAQAKREEAKKAAADRALERKRIAAAKPWNAPGLSQAEAWKVRYREDPAYNLQSRLRASFKRKRQGIKLSDLLRSAINRNGRSPRAETFLGYSTADLKKHLERQFTKGMDWQAFCSGDIHIDHIIPLSSFNLSDADELRAAWALSNLRPLSARENIAKAARRELLL